MDKIYKHKNKKIYFIFVLYLIVLLFGKNYLVGGGFSASFFMTVLMVALIPFQPSVKNFVGKKEIFLYIFYIFIFIMCSMFNGDMESGGGIVSLIVNYISCFLIFYYGNIYIRDEKDIKLIFNILIFFVLLNNITTILQFYNNDIGWRINEFFNGAENVTEDKYEKTLERLGHKDLFGVSLCSGIFDSSVYNGYFVSSLGLLSSFYVLKEKKFLVKLISFIFCLLSLVSLYVIQQRAAFYLFILSIGFLSFLTKNRKIITTVLFGCVIFVLFYINIDYQNVLGRFYSVQDSLREKIYSHAINYISNNWLIGGRAAFTNILGRSSHNILFNSIIYSGVFGAFFIIILYLDMIIKSVKVCIRSFKYIKVSYDIFFALGVIIFNLISLAHNNSLVTGDPLIWVMFILMLIQNKINYGRNK